MFDLDDPRFRPLWLRLLLVVVCLGWAGLEFYTLNPGWGVLFGGVGVYAVWRFFVVFSPRDEGDNT